jgi:hypothetical protein
MTYRVEWLRQIAARLGAADCRIGLFLSTTCKTSAELAASSTALNLRSADFG